MLKSVLYACGKFVQSMGTHSGTLCETLSTFAMAATSKPTYSRGKDPVIQVFVTRLSTQLSTTYFAHFNLFIGGLSPLSTEPITTTAKERIER